MRAHLHSDGSAAFDDGMTPLKQPQAAFPDPPYDPTQDPKPVPQRDPGDEDPEVTNGTKTVGLIGRRTRHRVL